MPQKGRSKNYQVLGAPGSWAGEERKSSQATDLGREQCSRAQGEEGPRFRREACGGGRRAEACLASSAFEGMDFNEMCRISELKGTLLIDTLVHFTSKEEDFLRLCLHLPNPTGTVLPTPCHLGLVICRHRTAVSLVTLRGHWGRGRGSR